MADSKNTDTKLNIYYQNVRGLRTKCLNLYNNILLNDYDFILMTETWLQNDILDWELCDFRYDVFRCDRNLERTNKCTGGGVMLCARRSLCADVVREWTCLGIESLCLRIPAHALGTSTNLLMVLVYLAPDQDNLPFNLEEVKINISRVIETYPSDNYLLIGDFNIPCISWTNSGFSLIGGGKEDYQNAALAFVEDLQYLGLTQYNLTRNSCNNILDLCFSSLPLSVTECQPISKLDIFHPPFTVDIIDLHVKSLKPNATQRFNFYKCDYEQINSFLKRQDWASLLDTANVEEAIDIFYNKLNECFVLFVPLTFPKNDSYPVWYSSALIKILREKSKYHRK